MHASVTGSFRMADSGTGDAELPDHVFTCTISNGSLLEPRARHLRRTEDINNASSCVAVHYGAMTSKLTHE